MLQALKVGKTGTLQVHHDTLTYETVSGLQFIDITGEITRFVTASGVEHGFLNVQSTHTTAAIVVNEHEPLLLDDMKKSVYFAKSPVWLDVTNALKAFFPRPWTDGQPARQVLPELQRHDVGGDLGVTYGVEPAPVA